MDNATIIILGVAVVIVVLIVVLYLKVVLQYNLRSTYWKLWTAMGMKTKEIYICLLIALIIGVAYYCHNHYGYRGPAKGNFTNRQGDRRNRNIKTLNAQLQYRKQWQKETVVDAARLKDTLRDVYRNPLKNPETDFQARREELLNRLSNRNAMDRKQPVNDLYDDEDEIRSTGNLQAAQKDINKEKNDKTVEEKITISQHKPTEAECTSFKSSQKFDCHPEVGVSETSCRSRGCCWFKDPARQKPISTDNVNDIQTPVDVPYCYFPRGYPGYNITNTTETDVGYRSILMKDTLGYYPLDVKQLMMEVIFETDNILHVKITDAKQKRYEVPLDVPKATKKAANPAYKVLISDKGQPFVLTVQRRGKTSSDDRTIFSTKDMAPLMFADQFLQLSSSLPTGYVYGVGERRGDLQMSVNWNRQTLWARDHGPVENINLYGSHPFYMVMEEDGNSNGFFLLNSNAMDVVLQPYPAITWRTIGGILDFYIFLGPTPQDVTRQYTSIIGRPFMPPYWGLGFHICRWGYKTVADTLEVVEGMRKAGIPQDTQWNDLDYMKDRKDFTTDTQKFGNQAELVKIIHSFDMKYIVIVDPGIAVNQTKGTYKPYDLGLQMDIFLKNDSGQNLIAKVWPGQTVFPDFTHPNAQKYWTTVVSDFIDFIPVDGLWIDMNEISSFVDGSIQGCPHTRYDEPPYVPEVEKKHLYSHTICASAKSYLSREYDVHNMYGMMETNATYQALRTKKKLRPFVISRSTFPGQGRYGGHWSGDNVAAYHDLYRSISEILSMNLFGIPMVGADICGFGTNTTAQLCLRWHQLGAFYPFSRNHNNDDNMPQEPFRFGDKVAKAVRDVYLTRYSLLPYLYTLFYYSHIQGDTVARGMFQEFPWDPDMYAIDTQFLWGSALLIVPVLKENDTVVKAKLPKKTNWYDFYTGLSYDGGQVISLITPLDKINLLVQGGSIIPRQKPAQTTTQSRLNEFSLIGGYCSQRQGYGVLYWDDGESLDSYEMKAYNEIEFYLNKTNLYSRVVKAGYLAKAMMLANITLYGVEGKPADVTMNGKQQQFSYDPQLKVLHVPSISPRVNLLQQFNLQITGETGTKSSALQPGNQAGLTKQFVGQGQMGEMRDDQFKVDKLRQSGQIVNDNRLLKPPQGVMTNSRLDPNKGMNLSPSLNGQNGLTNQFIGQGQDQGQMGGIRDGRVKLDMFRQSGQNINDNRLLKPPQSSMTNQISKLDQNRGTNLLPSMAGQNRLTIQSPLTEESKLKDRAPVSDLSKLKDRLPISSTGRLTDKLQTPPKGGSDTKLSGPETMTNKLNLFNRNKLTNPNLDKQSNQLSLSQNLPKNLPRLSENNPANKFQFSLRGSLTDLQPMSKQTVADNQVPGPDQSNTRNRLSLLAQDKDKPRLPDKQALGPGGLNNELRKEQP